MALQIAQSQGSHPSSTLAFAQAQGGWPLRVAVVAEVLAIGEDSRGTIDPDLKAHVAQFRKFLSGDTDGCCLFWGLQPISAHGNHDRAVYHEILLRGMGAAYHSAPVGVWAQGSPVKVSELKRFIYLTLEMIHAVQMPGTCIFTVNIPEKLLDTDILSALHQIRHVAVIELTNFPSVNTLERLKNMGCDVLLDDVRAVDWERVPNIAHLIAGIKIDYITSLKLIGCTRPMLARDLPNEKVCSIVADISVEERRQLQEKLRNMVDSTMLPKNFCIILECSILDDDLTVLGLGDSVSRVKWLMQGQFAHAEVCRVMFPACTMVEDTSSAERNVPMRHRIHIEASVTPQSRPHMSV